MKKLKFILIALVVIIVAAGACGFIFLKDKVALTPRNKAKMGVAKTVYAAEQSEKILGNMNSYKCLKNLESKPFEAEVSMNVDASIKNLEELVGDSELSSLIEDSLKELSNADITTKIAMDKENKKMVISGDLNAEKVFGKISGEAAISEKEIAFRSKEFNKNFLKITDKDEDMEEVFEAIKTMFETDYSKYKLTDEEIEHFKDTYEDVLDTVITDDKIKSDKGEFEVGGSKKSCTVTTVTLDEKTIGELLKKYIETFEKDEKGKEIIKEKFKALDMEDQYEDTMEELEDSLEELKEDLDDFEGLSIEFITYGSTMDVYGTVLNITIDEETLSIKQTFDKDTIHYVVEFEDEELATVDVKETDDEITIDAETEIEGLKVKMNITVREDFIGFKVESDNIATIEVNMNIDKKKDSDKELDQDIKLEISAKVPRYDIDGKVTMNLSEKVNVVDSIDFPDTDKAVSPFNESEFKKYSEECEKNATDILKKLEDSDIYKTITEYYNSKNSYSNYSNNNSTNYTFETKADPAKLKKNVEDWYKDIKPVDGAKKTETIENNMITFFDFDDYVDVDTYISWKEEEKEDKGYLKIVATDYDENKYEFYVDIEKGKVYDKNDVAFDVTKVTWNEYK